MGYLRWLAVAAFLAAGCAAGHQQHLPATPLSEDVPAALPPGTARECGLLAPGVGDTSAVSFSGSNGWSGPGRLGAAGGGVIIPFSSEMDSASGYVAQLGIGKLFGGGVRFMEFDYKAEGGERYDARTVLVYFGGGDGRSHSYMGLGVGSTRLRDESGRADTDLAGGLLIGTCAFHDFRRHGGIGVAAEIGAFFSDPMGVDLDGLSLLAGVYVYF